jgi:UDP-N-acetylglucosamine--N-acetylmuramyl-(pentapeptide) pyrophosphoryl-undecaprenol N-acetylglucosamine transferase
MKIALTGGGTGGHFYPLIAVAEEINNVMKERKLVPAKLYYFADKQYDPRLLFENNIEFRQISAGKVRRYFSILNLFDGIKTVWGIMEAVVKLFFVYPDVVFSKGGYVSFPVLWAARLLRIPVVIHESDSLPGRVTAWSAKFATRIAASFPESLSKFPEDRTALTGNPIREDALHPISQGAAEFLNLEPGLPVIYVTGGSQGATVLNDVILDILPSLLEKYQIIHQVGTANLAESEKRASFVLEKSTHKNRYKMFPYLNGSALRMVAGISDLVISRAGAGAIFEFAHWGTPAILIPIPLPISHDQRENAFAYARSGGAVVIEQNNLTGSVLASEIDRILTNQNLKESMKKGAKSFAKPDAGKKIAEEVINLALAHES